MAGFPASILVTGASGFVGRYLMARLAVTYPDARLIGAQFDVRDAADVNAVVQSVQPDVCVHLAAVSSVRSAQRDQDQTWQINLFGTLNLANAILAHAPQCLMLFASSADAYGHSYRAGAALTEDAPLAPMSVYAATKAAADLALGSMVGQGLRVIRLRPMNHTGPGQSPVFVVAAFAQQIARISAHFQPPLMQVGNLDVWRDFLDVRDVCAAYLRCIDRSAQLVPGTILNLGSGQPRRIRDVLNELQRLAGVAVEVHVDPSRVRPDEVSLTRVDAARARELLAWVPAIPWQQTLTDVLDDWRWRAAAAPNGPVE